MSSSIYPQKMNPQPERDPEYDLVPPLRDRHAGKRGMQCGECGMKFEYGQAYYVG